MLGLSHIYVLQETELRTLKASAEDIALKFDDAVAALAAKRLDLQIEVGTAGGGNALLPTAGHLQCSVDAGHSSDRGLAT